MEVLCFQRLALWHAGCTKIGVETRYGPEQYTLDECVAFAYQNEAQTAYENGVRGDAQTGAAVQGLISNWEYYADEYRVPYDLFKAEMKRRSYWEEPIGR